MSKLIQKAGFLNPKRAGRYMNYIATRDGVELLDENADSIYMRYIATRPRAEKHGEHGLFGAEDAVDLEKTLGELKAHEGNVWTIIYSLRREDAARLGYDNAASWRALLRSKQADFAEAMQIPPSQLRWYAAFHDEGEHPHIHMMLWSDDPKYGFLRKDKLLHLQSILTNMIYADELKAVYVQKDIAYKDVTGAARETMRRIVDRLESVKNPPESIQKKMMELVLELRTITGKSSMDISESRSRIWWIPSWMNWKKCRRLLRIMPSGTTCATHWRATTRTVLGSTTHSHSKKSSVPLRMPLSRKRSVCAVSLKNLLRRLLQILCLQMSIFRP